MSSLRILGTLGVVLALASSKIVIGLLTLETDHLIKKIGPALATQLPAKASVSEFLKGTSYLDKNYIIWLETVGVVPLPLDIRSPTKTLLRQMDTVDGLLLTGGNQSFYKPHHGWTIPAKYLRKVRALMKAGEGKNRRGVRFPIWGTCLGFQALLVSQSRYTLQRMKFLKKNAKVQPLASLDRTTVSGGYFNSDEVEMMTSFNTLFFHHHFGFSVQSVVSNPALKNEVKVVGVVGREGKEVVAWIEFSKFPFFGIQFHPEKYHFAEEDVRLGDLKGMKEMLGVRFAQFFKSQAVDRYRREGDSYCPIYPVFELFKNPVSLKKSAKATDLVLYAPTGLKATSLTAANK